MGWFRDRALAEIAINRSFHVNESCPALYTEWLPRMFGRPFLIGWGVQHPVEVCEVAFQAAQVRKNGVSCDEAISAVIRAATEHLASGLPVGPSLAEMAEEAHRRSLPLFILTTTFDAPNENYIGFLRFIHLPHDVLMLTARSFNGEPRLTDAVWVPDE